MRGESQGLSLRTRQKGSESLGKTVTGILELMLPCQHGSQVFARGSFPLERLDLVGV